MKAVQEVEAVLASEDPELRRRAVQLVPEVEEAHRPRLVLVALGDSDWRVRKEAVAVALELGPSPELVERLVAAFLPGDNVGLRNAAVETLAGLGSRAFSAIADALPTLDADGRKLAAEALGRAHDPLALPLLEALSSDPDPNVRVTALDQLAEVGGLARERAAALLIQALRDEELHVKLAALSGLQRLGAKVPWETLESLSSHPTLRAPALALAGHCEDPRAAAFLAEALEDERRSIFTVAVQGLASLVLNGKVSLSELRERLSKTSPAARARLLQNASDDEREPAQRAALVVSAVAGEPKAIDLALDALLGERVFREAEIALRIFGPTALPRILTRIGEGGEEARAALVSLLVSLVPHEGDADVAEALRQAIRDESQIVATSALIALATLGSAEDFANVAATFGASPATRVPAAAEAALASLAVRYPEAARAFARDAKDDEGARMAIAVAIGAVGGGLLGSTEDDLALLSKLLLSEDERARRAAAVALGDIGSASGYDLLQRALTDASNEVRLAAIASLGRLRLPDGSPAATSCLLELLREERDPELVAAAIHALGATGDPAAVPLLTELVGSNFTPIVVAAIAALARIDPVAGLSPFLEAARSDDPEVVKAALLALEGSSDPRALACFQAALDHEAWDVRTLAADCLGPTGGAHAQAWLRERLSREPSPIVREAIDRALGASERPPTEPT